MKFFCNLKSLSLIKIIIIIILHRYRAEVKSLTRTLEQLQKHGATLGVPLPGTMIIVMIIMVVMMMTMIMIMIVKPSLRPRQGG